MPFNVLNDRPKLASPSARRGSGLASIPESAPTVLLVDMPFRGVHNTSLGLGLLKATLLEAGIRAEVRHVNADFARYAGVPLYNYLSQINTFGSSAEIFFTPHYYGLDPEEFADGELQSFLREAWSPYLAQKMLGAEYTIDSFLAAARDLCVKGVPELLKQLMEDIAWARYDIVGFSLMFDQTLPSLTLARLIKAAYPSMTIVFGGPGCDDEMGLELMRVFPFVDIVSLGEADTTIVPLVEAIRAGGTPSNVPGIARRDAGTVVRTPSPPLFEDLDGLPIPDYDDYFAAVKGLGIEPSAYFETSRGCWWGQKHLCSFCGLNANGLRYRHKSPERAVQEIRTLAERYGCQKMAAADNILDTSYFKSVFPELRKWRDAQPAESRVQLFFEMKSNVKKEQLEAARAGGLASVQPGIESFNDHVLQLMDKGATGIQQIQFVRWAAELDIGVHYGILRNNPGETAEDYDEMRETVQHLLHLPPPHYLAGISLDRFSPYFRDPARYGITGSAPHPTYGRVFPDGAPDLAKLAYRFTFSHADHSDPGLATSVGKCMALIGYWLGTYVPGRLTYQVCNDEVVIHDARSGRALTEALRGIEADIFLYCDESHSRDAVIKRFDPDGTGGAGEAINRLRRRKWMYQDRKGRCISLPLMDRVRANQPSEAAFGLAGAFAQPVMA